MINNYTSFIKENKNIIRISCASLARIIINDKFLLCVNKSSLKNKNIKVYTPFGGSLEYTEEALDFLNGINSEFEKGKDLRLRISLSNLEIFKHWFQKKENREIGIDRELVEELVEEEKVFKNLSSVDFQSKYLKMVEDFARYNDIDNYRFFEIYNIEFNDNKLEELLKVIEDEKSNLRLVTKEEILNGKTEDGIEIGQNSKSLI